MKAAAFFSTITLADGLALNPTSVVRLGNEKALRAKTWRSLIPKCRSGPLVNSRLARSKVLSKIFHEVQY